MLLTCQCYDSDVAAEKVGQLEPEIDHATLESLSNTDERRVSTFIGSGARSPD